MFVNFQGHDFSFRGMQSPESAISSGMGFLTSFMGTDTLPTLQAVKHWYGDENVGFSVPATEHSVMCAHGKEGEIETLKYLMNQYPKGILSVVSDTWDLWKLITEYLPQLKKEILARDGKLVIRPDSGDPVDIICGLNGIISFNTDEFWDNYSERKNFDFQYNNEYYKFDGEYLSELFEEYGEEVNDSTRDMKGLIEHEIISKLEKQPSLSESKGVIELLWDLFGGTINKQGYKVLDSHIGAIYGDSINMERATQICERLKDKGFASTNIVFGVGSFTYQYNTRDTFGFAMKATYGEITHDTCDCLANSTCGECGIEPREIFKDPITDDGTKKSKKGLLRVAYESHKSNKIIVLDQQNWEQEKHGLLTTVFKNGKLVKETTLEEIRERLNNQLC